MDVVFGHADRVVVMNRGRIIAEGTPAEVRGNADRCARSTSARAAPRRSGLRGADMAPARDRCIWMPGTAARRSCSACRSRSTPARRSCCSAATAPASPPRLKAIMASGGRAPRVIRFDGVRSHRRPTHRIARHGARLRARGSEDFHGLTVDGESGRRTPARARGEMRLDARRSSSSCFRNLARHAGQARRAHVRRRAADAHHRARADGQSALPAARRAVGRARAGHCRGASSAPSARSRRAASAC